MQIADLIIYLANIITISRIDGKTIPKVENTLEFIFKNLNIDNDIVDQALKKASRDTYTITPVGRFSDKIKNLEEMLLIALVDGDLTSEEKKVILRFAKSVNITQDQINTILSETCRIIESIGMDPSCQNCGASIISGANFCTSCGNRL